jgi:hypothetical protein
VAGLETNQGTTQNLVCAAVYHHLPIGILIFLEQRHGLPH